MDHSTHREIDKRVWRTLRDAGIIKPPVQIERVLEHLKLFRDFYDLQNPGFLDKAKHKLRVNGKKVIEVIKRIELQAVLLFDEKRVVVDSSLPTLKQDWPSFHEAGHRILTWHRPYFFGDTAQTLDPEWQQALEAEANCAASAMMFCGPVFTTEAKDTLPGWRSVAELKKRYGKSYHTTLRRYVGYGPEHIMALLVSTPHWQASPSDQDGRCRHLVRSPLFKDMFNTVSDEELRGIVDANTMRRRGGPVGDFSCELIDDNGAKHEFRGEPFYNRYYIQTLYVHVRQLTTTRVVGIA